MLRRIRLWPFFVGSLLILAAVFLTADQVSAARRFRSAYPPFLDECSIDTDKQSSCNMRIPHVCPGAYRVYISISEPPESAKNRLEVEDILDHVSVAVRDAADMTTLYLFPKENHTVSSRTTQEPLATSRGIKVCSFEAQPGKTLIITCSALEGISWPAQIRFAITDSVVNEKAWHIGKDLYTRWRWQLVVFTGVLAIGGAILILCSVRRVRNLDAAECR